MHKIFYKLNSTTTFSFCTYAYRFVPVHPQMNPSTKIVLFLTLTLVILAMIPLYFYPLLFTSSAPSPPLVYDDNGPMKSEERVGRSCDIFSGEWIPNLRAPYYTNDTCWAIHDNQNCMKYGRPDTEFMKWRWKPYECELTIFNPSQFLEIVRGKSLAFIGDSLGRNQMQSLMCLLSRVSYAVDVSPTLDYKSRRWSYPTHNFTLANFWSPFLVEAEEAVVDGDPYTGLYNMHLDKADANWTAHIEEFDYVVVSAGHWLFRPLMYYENNRLVGCNDCKDDDVTDLNLYYGFRMAFRTTFKALNSLKGFKGVAFLRTYSPGHFENGEWNKGGDCVRTRPLRNNETRLEGFILQVYMAQLEEFRAAQKEARKTGVKFRLLDVTEAMLLRPDGHPSRYGHWPNEKVLQYNDCVHWCLPGPADAWNDFLLQMLKMEGWKRSPFSRYTARSKGARRIF